MIAENEAPNRHRVQVKWRGMVCNKAGGERGFAEEMMALHRRALV
jgi:hypothetical protein